MLELSKKELVQINGGTIYLRGTITFPFFVFNTICRLIEQIFRK